MRSLGRNYGHVKPGHAHSMETWLGESRTDHVDPACHPTLCTPPSSKKPQRRESQNLNHHIPWRNFLERQRFHFDLRILQSMSAQFTKLYIKLYMKLLYMKLNLNFPVPSYTPKKRKACPHINQGVQESQQPHRLEYML